MKEKKFLQASFEEMLFHSPDEGSTRKLLKLSLYSCSIFFGFLFTFGKLLLFVNYACIVMTWIGLHWLH